MGVAPPRYLVAHLGAARPEREALLRFPPGVTLEDAGLPWEYSSPTLSSGAVARLRRLGVEVVAVGREAALAAFRRARAESSSIEGSAFLQDYLGVNDRLGGERCVTVHGYAMHTPVGTGLGVAELHDELRYVVFRTWGARVYGDAAFREDSLPDVLRLPVGGLACTELGEPPTRARCLLHGDACGRYERHWFHPGIAISDAPGRWLGVRVPVPRSLLDDLGMARCFLESRLVARMELDVVRIALRALPRGAWCSESLAWGVASLVALAEARTCEEYAMLVGALSGCRSLREMERRVRDRAWVVSRSLEGPPGGR